MGKQIMVAIVADGKQSIQEFKSVGAASKYLADENKKTVGTLKSLGSSLDKAGDKLTSMGRKATIGLTLPIVAGFAGVIKAGTEMGDTISKTEVVFGSSAKGVIKWSEGMAKSFGISKQESLDAAATFAVLAKSTKMTTDESAKFSEEMVGLAGDLRSFSGGRTEDAIAAIGSALRGEAEPIRAYGVMLNDATLKARAMSMGLIQAEVDTGKLSKAQETQEKALRKVAEATKKYGADSVQAKDATRDQEQATEALSKILEGKYPANLTAEQKLLATRAEILAQTSLQQGDNARTADSAANKQARMVASSKDLASALGEKLQPAYVKLLDFGMKLVDQFNGLSPKMQNAALAGAGLLAALGPLMSVMGGIAKAGSGVAGAIEGVGKMANSANPFVATMGKGIGALGIAGLVVGGIWALNTVFKEIEQRKTDQKIADIQKAMAGLEGYSAQKEIQPAIDALKNLRDARDNLINAKGATPGFTLKGVLFGNDSRDDAENEFARAAHEAKKAFAAVEGAVVSYLRAGNIAGAKDLSAEFKKLGGSAADVAKLDGKIRDTIQTQKSWNEQLKRSQTELGGVTAAAGQVGPATSRAASVAAAAFAGIPAKIGAALGGLKSSMENIGAMAVQGLANGIANNMSVATNAARNVGSAVLAATRNIFQTKSPAVTTRIIGEHVGQGLADGITKSSKKAVAAAKKMAEDAIAEAEKALQRIDDAVSGMTGAASSGRGLRGAQSSVADAEEELRIARAASVTLPARIAAAEAKLAAARAAATAEAESATEITDEEQVAIESTTESLKKAREEHAAGTITTAQLRVAEQNLAKAIADAGRAAKVAEQDESELNDLRRELADSGRRIADAERVLADARDALTDATLANYRANKDLIAQGPAALGMWEAYARAAGLTAEQIERVNRAVTGSGGVSGGGRFEVLTPGISSGSAAALSSGVVQLTGYGGEVRPAGNTGGAPAPAVVNITVQGSVVTQQELVDVIRGDLPRAYASGFR